MSASNLKVMPKSPPQAVTVKEQIIQGLKDERGTVSEILVIYKTRENGFNILTNKADAGDVLLFLERFKLTLITRANNAPGGEDVTTAS